jgi:hypothetical protein
MRRMQVFHYATAGPVAYRLDWGNMSFCFSGKPCPNQPLTTGRGSNLGVEQCQDMLRAV